MKNILLVGCGGIGSRHLQSLKKLERGSAIYVVDPNDKSIEIAKSRYNEIPENHFIKSVNYYHTLDKINVDFDLAIIATNSNVRKEIINELFSIVNVKYLILEKVVFQSVDCFEEIINLLKTHSSYAWVNCVNRLFPAYNNLKTLLSNGGNICMTVDGGDWEISGNCIHYLDLFNFLSDRKIDNINIEYLEEKVYESRRPGYVDFNGQITANTKFGDKINLSNDKNNSRPVSLQISNDNLRCFIFEHTGEAIIQKKSNNWDWEKISFPIIPQSKLTNIIIEDIFTKGTCGLSTIEESFLLHKLILESFTTFINAINGQDSFKCPIT